MMKSIAVRMQRSARMASLCVALVFGVAIAPAQAVTVYNLDFMFSPANGTTSPWHRDGDGSRRSRAVRHQESRRRGDEAGLSVF